jgi:pyridoxal phosphate enzyme (YggS family)
VADGADREAAGDRGVAAVNADAGVLSARVADVHRRVRDSGGDPGRMRIVAVTKGFGPEAVQAAKAAGLADVGENYAQELLAKAELLAQAEPPASAGAPLAGIRWHFLGPVQRNKVKGLAPLVGTWHGIDREAAADAVAGAAPGSEVMVQVNVTGDANRPGCRREEVDRLVAHIRTLALDLSGLMAVGPAEVGEGSRTCFRWLAAKARELGVRELSMGMSEDFEMAVSEGATTLRLGRVLFGDRPKRTAVRR